MLLLSIYCRLGEAPIDSLDVKVVKAKLARTTTEKNHLEKRVLSLSHKLSAARAFPLFSLGQGEGGGDGANDPSNSNNYRDGNNDGGYGDEDKNPTGGSGGGPETIVDPSSGKVIKKKQLNTTLGRHLMLEYAEKKQQQQQGEGGEDEEGNGSIHIGGTMSYGIRLTGVTEEYLTAISDDDSDAWSAAYLAEERQVLQQRNERRASMAHDFRNRIQSVRNLGPEVVQEARKNRRISNFDGF